VHPAHKCLIIYLYTNRLAIKIKSSLETKYSEMVMRPTLVTAYSDLLCYWHFQFYVYTAFLHVDSHIKTRAIFRLKQCLLVIKVHAIYFIKEGRQCTQKRNIRVRSPNHYIHIVWVFRLIIPAGTAHAPYCIVICGLCGCTTFFYIIS
jgi:hypothetical protein